MADTSLIWNIIARDRTSAILNKIESRASSVGKTVAVALGPALLPAAGVGVGAIMSIGAAVGAAGIAMGVFGGVVKSAMTEVGENATKVTDLTDKIKLYKTEARLAAAAGQDNEKYLKKQAEATLELKARLANLPPATREATMSFIQMKSDWGDFVDQNKPATFNLMSSGYKLMGSAILQLQPFFDMAISSANRLFGGISQWVAGGALQRLAAVAGPSLQTLTSIMINAGTAIGRMFGKIGAAQGQGILEWIERMTRKWAEWAGATQKGTGINKFIEYLQTNGPRVATLLGQIAGAAVHIAQAVSPLAPISLAIATALASFVQAIPPNVLTALVAGFVAFNVAMRAWALGSAIATAAQWAFNTALMASGIPLIIAGVALLAAGIIYLATKTQFFQTVWKYIWNFMKAVGAWFAGPFANFFVALWNKVNAGAAWLRGKLTAFVSGVKIIFTAWVNTTTQIAVRIVAAFMRVVNFVRSAPGKIGGALKNMFTPLWNGFKTVVNRIIGGWNRLSFGIPGFSFAGISVPGINVSTPNIPYLAKGAGSVRQSGLAFIHRGETVTPAARVTPFRSGDGGGGGTLTIRGDGSRTANFLLEILREAIRDKGGDVVKVLTTR